MFINDDEPLIVYAVYIRYAHIEHAELDTLFFDKEDAEKRCKFLNKYAQNGKPFCAVEVIE